MLRNDASGWVSCHCLENPVAQLKTHRLQGLLFVHCQTPQLDTYLSVNETQKYFPLSRMIMKYHTIT